MRIRLLRVLHAHCQQNSAQKRSLVHFFRSFAMKGEKLNLASESHPHKYPFGTEIISKHIIPTPSRTLVQYFTRHTNRRNHFKDCFESFVARKFRIVQDFWDGPKKISRSRISLRCRELDSCCSTIIVTPQRTFENHLCTC